jgi:hypothetical protein
VARTRWSRTNPGWGLGTEGPYPYPTTLAIEHHGVGLLACAMLDHLLENVLQNGAAAKRGVLQYCVRCRAEVHEREIYKGATVKRWPPATDAAEQSERQVQQMLSGIRPLTDSRKADQS